METILLSIRNRFATLATRRLSAVWLVLIAIALAGCATAPPPKGVATCTDKLSAGDLIGIKIQGVQDPPTFQGPIGDDGEIEILYMGKFKAAGFTDIELAERIKYMLIEKGIFPPSVLPNMIITVLVETRFYYVTGEGPRGRFPLTGTMTVCRALLAAGLTDETANRKKIILHRGTQKIRVNCIKGAYDASYDIQICAGDIIEIPRKGILPFL
ncbi:MAG: hypothetical protein EXS18_04710 [Verrucomicrobiae bacterium]|nr:hypothetical protein [Verrucomicrobiae bacterium]